MNKYIIVAGLSFLSMAASAQENTDSAFYDTDVSIGYNRHSSLKNSPYSVSSISVSDMQYSSELDILKSLYGKIAGLDVYQGSGMSAWNYAGLRLQGHEPLILVDGFPRSAAALTMIEIESIDVLTDAASSALYGVRGANGVINIRTKKAVSGPLKVSVGYRFGMNSKFRSPDFANAHTYAQSLNTAYRLDGFADARYNEKELQAFREGNFPFSYPDVDWQNEVLGDFGSNHQLDFLVTGGKERFRYLTALVYSYDCAMLKHTNDDSRYTTKPFDVRLNLRTNIEIDITSSTLFSVNLMGRLQEINSAINPSLLFSSVYNTPAAAFPVKTQDGIFGGNNIYGENNPVALAGSLGYNKDIYSTLFADMRIRQDLSSFIEGLYADVAISFDNRGVLMEQAGKSYRYQDIRPTMHGDGTVTINPVTYGTESEILWHDSGLTGVYLNSDFQAQAGYDRTINSHRIGGSIIYDQQSSMVNGQNNSMKRQSFIANASWSFRDKYILNGVFTYSGSAVLPANDRYIAYPAISAAWIVSNEDFMSLPFLNFMKIKASYGLSGWDGNTPHDLDLQNYIWSDGYYFGDNASYADGQREGNLAVENLTLEKSKKANVGVDLGLFGNSLNFSADFFYNRRSNILVNSSNAVSQIIGIGVGQLNAGVTDYKGVDLSAAWNNRTGDFSYGLSGAFSFVRSKIINLNEQFQQYDYLYHKGNSASQVYGLECIGFFNNQAEINNSPVQTFSVVRPGDVKYKDQNGDNVIDDNDAVKMYRTGIPEVFYGFSLQLGWKNFGFTADFQGVTNRTVSLLESPLYQPLVNNGNISDTFLDRETPWTPENTKNVTMPRLTTQSNRNNYVNSSLWYRNGSFLKLRNISLNYDFPRSATKFANCQLFLRGANLFSIDYIGFADPEQLGAGYPSLRSYWAGFKVQF
ncbi:MAG: SusC/RagA family TonB-linked outer membrane protein [Tannerella sp.]|nr:SusC/RagA family TonB-linked outer membrane protein [Tannerella sp.]